MLVYAQKSSARLEYILHFISEELFDHQIRITSDKLAFSNYDEPKINYSSEKISDNELRIHNVNLLFEDTLVNQTISCFEVNNNKAFFQTYSGDYPFDIFAACFYLLSRYEEYLPHHKDKYGRYAHTNSLAFKESFLQLPLINFWLNDFKESLERHFPGIPFKNNTFTFVPTYDIDIAWSYRNKGWWRNTGGLLRSVINFDGVSVKDRVAVLLKNKPDPFDSYEWLNEIHKRTGSTATYFFLLAKAQKGYDKNISPIKQDLVKLVKAHDQLYTTGIHPSWQSGDDDLLLHQEIESLKSIVGHEVIHSRQHYLRFTLPATYQKLIELGIKNEYSMAYGTMNGFRASVASSFFWFDLEKNKITDLRIHPFCFMDANAYYEQKLSPPAALRQLINLYEVVKKINGTMITLWHNNFLGTDPAFAGWREVYERFITDLIADA